MVTTRVYNPWTMNELKLVREKYAITKTKVLSDELGRSEASIRFTAHKYGITKLEKDSGQYTHGVYKIERVVKLLQMLHNGHCSFAKIQDEFGITKRTAYRYISLLIASGIKVEKEGNSFFIHKNNCPLCGNHNQ
jgi:predicted transcriptional regulator